MWWFLALLFIIALINVTIKDASQKREKRELEEEYHRQKNEVTERIYSMINMAFESLGWSEWDESVHRADGQYMRMEWANADKMVEITEFNTESKTAEVRVSNGDTYFVNGSNCSCPDFRHRKLPCKHMYFVAMEHGVIDEERLS